MPIVLYWFVVMPSIQLLQQLSVRREDWQSDFFTIGFCWAVLAYPLALAIGHLSTMRNRKAGLERGALMNQIALSLYLILLAAYGFVAFA